MTPPAHLAAGYLINRIFREKEQINQKALLIISLIGSFAPDIDGFYGGMITGHRTIFHTPLFWMGLTLLSYFYLRIKKKSNIMIYLAAFSLGAFGHIFLDWFSSRTAGIRVFYPFIYRDYSLFPLDPTQGHVAVWPSREQLEFWRFYLENTFLVVIEISIIIVGIFLCVSDIIRKRTKKQVKDSSYK